MKNFNDIEKENFQFKKGDIFCFFDGNIEILSCKFNGKKIKIRYSKEFGNKELILNKDELKQILELPNITIFTHNCMEKLVCGQLGSVASRMALDDNQATTIDGTHKGAGMVKAQGILSNIQYYFEDQKWITKWFVERGMTETGWDKNELDAYGNIETSDNSEIDLGEDEDISIEEKVTTIEFQDIHKEIDNTKPQKFEEV